MLSDLKGHTFPRIETKPLRELTPETTLGFDCLEFARDLFGWQGRPWQEHFLKRALELRPDGRLRFRVVLLLVARQNGKSAVMIVLALYFMLVLKEGEPVLSTAQNLDTSQETWNQGLELLESVDSDPPLVAKTWLGAGRNAMKLDNGSRWAVAAANRGGGRGKSSPLVLMDELREHLSWDSWNAISNTTLAQEDALVLGVSNAGDSRSVVLRDLRRRAIESLDDPDTQTLICEWSAAEDDDTGNPLNWAKANPSLGYGLSLDALRVAYETSTEVAWRTENLCQWVNALEGGPWKEGVWESGENPASCIAPDSEIVLAVDTSIDRAMSYVTAVGANASGRTHVEVIAMREGDAWVVPWVNARWDAIGASKVVIQGKGAPATGLIDLFEERGIPVYRCQGSDVTGSAMEFFSAVRDGLVEHLPQPVLDIAAKAAQTRLTGDGLFMFDRRKSPVDIAPLVAVSMAWFVFAHSMEVSETESSAYESHGLMVF